MRRLIPSKTSAFTLVEIILGITVLSIVLVGITVLTLTSIQANAANVHRLTAYYLAQEGVEGFRTMRDSNWMQNYVWNEGKVLWGADFSQEGFYVLTYQPDGPAPWALSYFGANREWAETAGAVEDIFTRTVEVSFPDESNKDLMEVTAVVSWRERSRDTSVEVSTEFTDWREGPL